MKSIFVTFRNLRLRLSLTLGICLANVVWSAPSIQSIEVSPNPLTNGQSFSIAVTASPDVIRALATVDFRPGQPQLLEIPLTKQGETWIGSGVVPQELRRQLPFVAGAKVKVVLFDAAGLRAVGLTHPGLEIVSLSAAFANGILTVTGDDHDNTLIVSRDAAGTILVNGGTVPVTGDVPTIVNTTLIRILGLEGNDVLLVDGANAPMPPARLFGGEGNDALTGSTSADELDGGAGDDILRGRDGDDSLFGGPGNDNLFGDRGVDGHFGGDGDDQLIWLPGDGSDLIEGQGGSDTLLFIGANGDELVNLTANGQRLTFFRNPGNITMDCDGVEQVIFQALGGVDQVDVNNLTGTQVTNVLVDLLNALGAGDGQADFVTVTGTDTNDLITIVGSTNGVEVLGLSAAVTILGSEQGGDKLVINTVGSSDRVDASAVEAGAIDITLNGGAGNDELLGGSGNDTLVWNPGDGSDVFEGQAGQDTMLFNGAGVGETVDLSVNGGRLTFFRNPGNITMDCNEVEVIQFNALGGADVVTIANLSGTGVAEVNLDLGVTADSGQGDNQADTVIVNGTGGADVTTIIGSSAGVSVAGLAATVNLVGSEAAFDQLIIHLLAGEDIAEASGLQAGVISLTMDGGQDDDVLVGGDGADTLLGGDGDDVLLGGPGLDVLDGGSGDNIIIQD
jgi:Ca2+-binding RTX toxin-like protein